MNKILLTILLITVVALSACSATTTTNEDGTTTNINVEDDDGFFSFDGETSIEKLMEKGKAMHCTFSQEEETSGEILSQEMYIDGDRMYVEMNMKGDNEMTVYTIDDGKYTWTWTSEENKGMKFKTEKDEAWIEDDEEFYGEEGEYNLEGENTEGADVNLELNYKCEGWRAKNSQFEPPKDVEFVDLAAMMEGLEGLEGLAGMFD